MNREALPRELARARPVTFVVDIGVAALLAGDAFVIAGKKPLVAVLTMILIVLIGLARIVLEPVTASAAFGSAENGR
jgi:hypothetical protein